MVLGVFGASDKARGVLANKLWQGLACGRTVITQESPALAELRPIVGDQLVASRPGDPSSLAGALLAVHAHPFADRTRALEEYAQSGTGRVTDWLQRATS